MKRSDIKTYTRNFDGAVGVTYLNEMGDLRQVVIFGGVPVAMGNAMLDSIVDHLTDSPAAKRDAVLKKAADLIAAKPEALDAIEAMVDREAASIAVAEVADAVEANTKQ